MLASPTALKDYLFADSEAEYQLNHFGSVDIPSRELSAPAGARYLRKPDEHEDRTWVPASPRGPVSGSPTPGLERSHAAYVASLVDVTGSQDE